MSEKINKTVDFESAVKRLDKITEELTREGVSLEDALALYEEGVKLASKCATELESAKRKIKILQQGKDGEIELVDMPLGDENE